MRFLQNEPLMDALQIILCAVFVAIWPLWFNWLGLGVVIGMAFAHLMTRLAKFVQERTPVEGKA